MEQREREEFQKLMERIEKSNAGQEKYARRQCRMSQVTAAAAVLMLAAVVYTCWLVVPKVNDTYRRLDMVMGDLEVITSELASADLDRMITDIDSLVVSGEENIDAAMEKLNAIDIEKLNGAIGDLADVISPLADFFGRFQ